VAHNGRGALVAAARRGDLGLVKRLVAAHASRAEEGGRPGCVVADDALRAAAAAGHAAVVSFIVSLGVATQARGWRRRCVVDRYWATVQHPGLQS
jgi:hypothetical protein